jgi:hypothetical protein
MKVWRDMCKDYLNGLQFGKESVDKAGDSVMKDLE